MEIVVLFFCLVFIDYIFFIGLLVHGASKLTSFDGSPLPAKTTFSVVVPFRNEAKNLPDLLQSFLNLDYPKELFEIIFVDDASEDESVNLINQWRMVHTAFHVTILDNVRTTAAPKKDAITRAVSISKKDWIITTDADCMVPPTWLTTVDTAIRQQASRMIIGAVAFRRERGLLSHFQQMDLLSLQGATMGSFGLELAFMCNGANLAYERGLFSELDGFKGNSNIASGDDVFLLQKAVGRYPDGVYYLKSEKAIVLTKPLKSWKALFLQHVRWASKSGAYQSDFSKGLAIIVFLANFCLLLALVLAAMGALNGVWFVAFAFVKFTTDLVLMWQTNRFLKMKMTSVLISSVIYPFFCVAVALYSIKGSYSWKGRHFTPGAK